MTQRASINKRSSRRVTSRRALVTLAVLFTLSGVARFGAMGMAAADDLGNLLLGTSAKQDGLSTCQTEADIERVLAVLQERESALATKEQSLKTRLEALASVESEVALKLAELKAAEDSLSATMATAATAASDDLARLVSLYENMKPKQAVPMFETMDPDFAAGFLSRMKPEIAAQILAGLDPNTAYAISVVFASRNAAAPTR